MASYQCECCEKRFTESPHFDADDNCVVCDPCFRELTNDPPQTIAPCDGAENE